MATRTDLYTSRNLPYNLLPRSQWTILCKYDIRFRPLHKHGITPLGAKGYFQLRIQWGERDTWVMLEESCLPLNSKQLAQLVLRGIQLRKATLAGLGPPQVKRSHNARMVTPDDKLRVKRYRRKIKRGTSDAGRARSDTTLAAVAARRSKIPTD